MDFNVVVAKEIHASLIQRQTSPVSSPAHSEDYRSTSNVSSPVHDVEFAASIGCEYKERPATKRKRHNLTPAQSRVLEKTFVMNPHPGRKMRMEISNLIKLDIDKVRKWFENRRNKAKKILQNGGTLTEIVYQADPDTFEETVLAESNELQWKLSLFPKIASDVDTQPAAIISSMRSQCTSIRSSDAYCSSSDSVSNFSDRDDHHVLEASSISGDKLGEMVAPYVSEFIFHTASRIRDRFIQTTNASEIVMAQETFRTNAEKLFQCINYDCRMSLVRRGVVYDTCCFSFFVGASSRRFCEVSEIRINCVVESDAKSVDRIVFHVHSVCSETFTVGCRRSDPDAGNGEIWGDTKRLRRLLDVTMHNQDLWLLLIFLGLGRPSAPEQWLSDLIATLV